MSIKLKIILSFSLLSFVPTALAGLVAFQAGRDTIRENAGLLLQTLAYETITLLDRNLEGAFRNIKTWSRLDLMQEVVTDDLDSKISQFLIQLSREYRSFSHLNVVNNKGIIVSSSLPDLIGLESQLHAGAPATVLYQTDAHFDPTPQKWVLSFAFPIRAKFGADEVLGTFEAYWLMSATENILATSEGRVTILNEQILLFRRDGLLIASSKPHQGLFKSNWIQTGSKPVRLASQKGEGYLVEQRGDEKAFLVGYNYSRGSGEFSGFGWGILVEQDLQTALAPIHQLKSIVVRIGAAIALLVFLISVLVARKMVRPILNIAQAARKISEGNFESQVVYTRRDEIGILVKDFNQMAANLENLLHKEKEFAVASATADVEKKKAAELASVNQKLKETAGELARSNRELEQFAYVASHDLQEPLRMVSSFTKLLERRYKDVLDQDGRDFIQFAVNGSERMRQLINDLLDYSRVTIRGKAFQRRETARIYDEAVDNLQVALEESSGAVTCEDLPVVMGDESQLVRLFQNLIGNAIKYRRKEEPPRVVVSAKRQGSQWLFSVRDNGIGIEAKDYEAIFQIFRRLHTGEEYKGTGIGLSVARKIVERHSGWIWVESQPGKGSTFYFTIPVVEEQGRNVA